MTFSIVTVCYNAATELESTIESVLSQDYPNIEYIIIDGGSKDGSVDIIRNYANRLAYWVSEPDKGIYDAMNKGIAATTGDYINFMNVGDRFASSTVLSEVVKSLHNERPEVVYGDVIIRERDMEYLSRPKDIAKILPKRMAFCHQATFVATNYIKQHLFDTSYICAADYNMFYNAYFKFNVQFQYIPVTIAVYDESKGFSKANLKITHRERYRIWGIENDKMKVLKNELNLIIYQFRGYIKRNIPLSLIKLYRK